MSICRIFGNLQSFSVEKEIMDAGIPLQHFAVPDDDDIASLLLFPKFPLKSINLIEVVVMSETTLPNVQYVLNPDTTIEMCQRAGYIAGMKLAIGTRP